MFAGGSDGNNISTIFYNADGRIWYYDYIGATFTTKVESAAVFRDFSAWFHLVVSVDTTQATSSNRVRIYVNGTQLTNFATATYPSQNADTQINTTTVSVIGRESNWYNNYSNFYLADIHFIDGQALTPSSFTEVSATTGRLEPKQYTGSFGTNGFWLKFSDNSAATAATLGKDYSGNNNNWTPNNLSVTAGAGNDSLVDTPSSAGTDTGLGGQVTGNYATLNPLIYGGSISAPTNGNLDISSGSSYGTIYATIGANSGKWYWEFTNTSTGSNGSCVGIAAAGATLSSDAGAYSKGYIYCSGALKANNNSYGSYGASWNTSGDIIGVAFDSDNGTLTFYKNGSSQGQAYSGIASTTEYYFPVFADASGSASGGGSFNFGQRPFAYTAPSGFKALCDTNLPAPVVAKSSDYFQTVLWTGNSSTQTVSGLSFSPDLVWLKCRNDAYGHRLLDTVRGATIGLASQSTAAESTESTGLTAFNSDGFTLGSNVTYNESAKTYVGWAFDAGTTTTTNTAGSITTSLRASASSGFSVISYTGTGSAGASIGHGLGVAPAFALFKNRSTSSDWQVYHVSLGNAQSILLQSTAAAGSSSAFNSTSPTSTVITLGAGTSLNSNGSSHICYAWAPVTGYSSFGSYTGNGSTDGPFVYTGFRPRWILTKETTAANVWTINDTARDPYNAAKSNLWANQSSAEDTSTSGMDILSNGFKPRTSANYNNSGQTYIYAAFAENPFQYARAR